MSAGSADRYGQASIQDSRKFVPEGVEGRVVRRIPERMVERSQYHLVQALKRDPTPDLTAPLLRDLGVSCMLTGRHREAEKFFIRLREHKRFSAIARFHHAFSSLARFCALASSARVRSICLSRRARSASS